MNNLLEFLTSKEIIVIYIVAGVACLLCFVIYLVEKNNEKLKRKHNTRELNRLVEMIKEEEIEQEEAVMYEQPILQVIEEKEESVVNEMLEVTAQMEKIESNVDNEVVTDAPVIIETKTIIPEEIKDSLVVIEEESSITENTDKQVQKIDENVEKLQYTSIEPDQATAQLELKRLTEELRKQEAQQQTQQIENIALTNFEEQQEESAIISLDELVKKGKEMYESNETTQYADEGNVPISLDELEKTIGFKAINEFEQPFVLENVVPNEEKQEDTNIRLDNVNTALEQEKVTKRFKNSPIISPIYGIEKADNANELALENTANYEKLDKEIKRTNEFLMSLKELQKKLD